MPRGFQKAKMPCDPRILNSWRFQPLLQPATWIEIRLRGQRPEGSVGKGHGWELQPYLSLVLRLKGSTTGLQIPTAQLKLLKAPKVG